MFRSRDGGDFLLKVKSKYIGDTKFDKDDKDKIYDTAVSLKDYRMQTKDKKQDMENMFHTSKRFSPVRKRTITIFTHRSNII